jgi:hypothetical protein
MYFELNEKNLASVYKNASTYGSTSGSDAGEIQPAENTKTISPQVFSIISSEKSDSEPSDIEPVEHTGEIVSDLSALHQDVINLSSIQASNNQIHSFVVNLEKSVSEVLSNIKDYIENTNEKLEMIKKQVPSDVDAYKAKVSKYVS